MNIRVGLGFDVHRLAPDYSLRLGGVRIPHPTGLVGHSDADAVLHAIIDALLGAASLGTIGERFPDTDPAYKDVDSAVLLKETAGMVRGSGFEIGNIDCNILAEKPRLSPYFTQMEANIASVLAIGSGQISVKAKSMEGLGAIGREEAIAAEAVVLVYAP